MGLGDKETGAYKLTDFSVGVVVARLDIAYLDACIETLF